MRQRTNDGEKWQGWRCGRLAHHRKVKGYKQKELNALLTKKCGDVEVVSDSMISNLENPKLVKKVSMFGLWCYYGALDMSPLADVVDFMKEGQPQPDQSAELAQTRGQRDAAEAERDQLKRDMALMQERLQRLENRHAFQSSLPSSVRHTPS